MTMRAVVLERFGDPARVLDVRHVPIPEPAPGQVRVRMRVRPINPSDLSMIAGRYGRLPTLPATPGFEGVGVIDAVGPGVSGLSVGQRVVPFTRSTWQEWVIAEPGSVLPVPDGIDDAQAAMLAINPTSAWLMLEEELRVQPGEWVLQNAGNSAVGRYVGQLARRGGYRVISVVRRREVVGDLLAEGADQVICEADEDVVERVREITGGAGVRHAIESVGGESGTRIAAALGEGGTMLVFGAIARRPITVDTTSLLFRGCTIRGWWLSRWMREAAPERRAGLFRTVVDLVREGTLSAPVAAEYDLGDVGMAVAHAASGVRDGKVLLVG